jgi:hypothetical protein
LAPKRRTQLENRFGSFPALVSGIDRREFARLTDRLKPTACDADALTAAARDAGMSIYGADGARVTAFVSSTASTSSGSMAVGRLAGFRRTRVGRQAALPMKRSSITAAHRCGNRKRSTERRLETGDLVITKPYLSNSQV